MLVFLFPTGDRQVVDQIVMMVTGSDSSSEKNVLSVKNQSNSGNSRILVPHSDSLAKVSRLYTKNQ